MIKNLNEILNKLSDLPKLKRKQISDILKSVYKQGKEDAFDKVNEKSFPRISIERMGWDDKGHITFIDLHDEKFGEAIFFGQGDRHNHGFLNRGIYF